MYYRYAKRRSTNYFNINQIEQVSYYGVQDESGNEVKELAIYFVSGRIYKERNKAEEMYKQLKRALEQNLWNASNQNLESTNLTNNISAKLHNENKPISNSASAISSIHPPLSNSCNEDS